MQIAFVADETALFEDGQAALAVLVFEDAPSSVADAVDRRTGGALGRSLNAGRFTGASGKTLSVWGVEGIAGPLVVMVGAGKREALDAAGVEAAAAHAYAAAKSSGAETLAILLPARSAEFAARAAMGARLAAYRFDRYRTTEKPEQKPTLKRVVVAAEDAGAAETAYAPLAALAEGVEFARDLASEPANVLYPDEFARRVQALTDIGLEVEVLDEAEMARLGMGALLGVGQGSVRDSRLVVAQWRGGGDAQPLAFVGKGVCFDTGGISIKPAEGMEDMKWDMGGAGAVAGLMKTLALRKAKVNAVGLLGLVENMPDGAAQRPGDVVKSLSGQTIEVINTDAEGRLVLADALWYCQERFKPRFMVDLATLTGAIIISLGHDYAGLFANDDGLAEALTQAGTVEGEKLWRLPLPAAYEKQIESPIADMKNIGGRPAGSITAALFLQKFVNGLPWAHLDIAAVAWRKDSGWPTVPQGATGFGVRLLNRLCQGYEG